MFIFPYPRNMNFTIREKKVVFHGNYVKQNFCVFDFYIKTIVTNQVKNEDCAESLTLFSSYDVQYTLRIKSINITSLIIIHYEIVTVSVLSSKGQIVFILNLINTTICLILLYITL